MSAQESQSVLAEAAALIDGERRDDYGPVEESFDRIAAFWSPVLGIEVTGEQVALCMIGLKMSRWLNGQQRDSMVDAAGYAALAQRVHESRIPF